jgi:hypothetical protein
VAPCELSASELGHPWAKAEAADEPDEALKRSLRDIALSAAGPSPGRTAAAAGEQKPVSETSTMPPLQQAHAAPAQRLGSWVAREPTAFPPRTKAVQSNPR